MPPAPRRLRLHVGVPHLDGLCRRRGAVDLRRLERDHEGHHRAPPGPRMTAERPLFIPVVLGTVRRGRMSAHVATVMAAEVAKRPGVETELIDIARLPLRTDDAGEATKDAGFSATMNRADALVIVS